MTDAQKVNQDDHAFSKFTQFDHVYANQLLDPASQTTAIYQENVKLIESPGTSPKASPSLPKRPISPAKPPRKNTKDNQEIAYGPVPDAVQKLSHSFSRTDSASFSKIPQFSKPAIAPKPIIPVVLNTAVPFEAEKTSKSSDPGSPALWSRPSFVSKNRTNLKKQTSFSDKASPTITSISNNISATSTQPEKISIAPPSVNRPPVPARPPHTLGIASTDVKPSEHILYF